ncbi:hypothetical protein B4O97_10695 [Marispirochaeta aestuarii]|uniref:Tripartite ATP-independent periplasmic transporters DctQ component domain-containing protein n=1 Tax=Marispirochaeta aestuarii TaxID=1963862 RepID=A0A1Y1RXT2_9SPIO|nr:TRAP transporter small permease [Marispirochaeta aestuarii]ORC35184.1 hypothetical protein B4O97_10695 [Marispirochaeta aestuarii]
MRKILQWIDINFEPVMMAVLFYAITILIAVQVVLRFVFAAGFSWGEEVARFMFVWLMYFSISYATRNQRHIRVTILIKRFSEKVQKYFMLATDFIFLLFSIQIFIAAMKVCESVFRFKDMAVTINVSLNIVYGAGVVGFALVVIRLIQSIVWKLNKFHDSLEIFENYAGIYSGAGHICFLPKSVRKETVRACEGVE